MCHRLSPTNRDKLLRPDQAALVASPMYVYEIDIPKLIDMEILNRPVSINTDLVFPNLLIQICLDHGVPEVPGVGQFFQVRKTTNLGLI